MKRVSSTVAPQRRYTNGCKRWDCQRGLVEGEWQTAMKSRGRGEQKWSWHAAQSTRATYWGLRAHMVPLWHETKIRSSVKTSTNGRTTSDVHRRPHILHHLKRADGDGLNGLTCKFSKSKIQRGLDREKSMCAKIVRLSHRQLEQTCSHLCVAAYRRQVSLQVTPQGQVTYSDTML